MNIQFKKVNIENFRSIEKAEVVLSQQGIVIVKGINEYEDKASSNGSGKSSIFEAIVFALFEETSNGEKNVANRIINNGYSIVLEFTVDTIEYRIIRKNDGKKSEVKLFKNNEEVSARNKTDTNKQIVQLLNINKDLFLDSIFLSQGTNTNLASLQPTARKERLEILTNTDSVVNSFKDKLKEKQVEYEAKCVEWEKEKNQLTGNIQVLLNQQNQYTLKIAEIDAQIKYRDSLGNLTELEKEISDILKAIDDLRYQTIEKTQQLTQKQAEIDKYKDDNKTLLEKQNEIMTSLNSEKLKLTKIQSEITTKSQAIVYEEENIKKINLEIEKILKSDTCPTCGRKYENVNEEHITSTINEYKNSINKIQNNIIEYTGLKDILNKELQKQQEVINELEKELIEIQNQIDTYNLGGNNLVSEKQNIQTEYDKINNAINQYNINLGVKQDLKDKILKIHVGNKKEFEDLLNENNKQLEKLQQKQKDILEKYEIDNTYVGTIKHCQQLVTKDFRSYLLKNSIDYINTLLKSYSLDLFSNEKDKIYILGDDSKLDIMLGDANYESLSGGEKTRVNIALLLAQKSLANSIGNISCNIIVLDEILGYCDSYAENNIINLITKELSSLESIYMISHKELPIPYDYQLIIQKDKTGLSHIIER